MQGLQGVTLGKRYTITEQIGSGGMAVVYKGQDTLLDRTVTIKILREQYASDQTFVERFRKEAQAVARLSHPNIVSIYDVGEEGPNHYLVMEYVPGWTLKELIRERAPLSVTEACTLVAQLLEGLEHAHNNSIIHRDIKPQNLLVTPAGRVKITDFGLARAASEATVTFPGSIIGSIHYLAPEQAKGEPATSQSDLYALGVVLYEMLTGKLPFQGETPVAIAMQHLQGDPPPPRQFNQEIPPVLEGIVLKSMAKHPGDRFPSAAAMRRELENMAESSEDLTRVLKPLPESAEIMGSPEPSAPMEDLKKGDDMYKTVEKRGRRLRWWIIPLLLVAAAWGLYAGWQVYWAVAEVEVPPVVGLPLEDAERAITAAGLRWQLGDKRTDPSIKAGYVLSQDPEANEKVKTSRVVSLEVSLGPSMSTVPSVAGLTEREARIKLEAAKLKVNSEIEEVYDASLAVGTVVRTLPQEGKDVAENTSVTLFLSRGPEPKAVSVPKLSGQSLEEAKKALADLGLSLGEVTTSKEENSKYIAGTVLSQDPEAGTPALGGSTVDVVLSPGPGPMAKTANVSGINIPNDGRQHRVRILLTDARGKNQEVYNRLQDPGKTFSTMVTYYGSGSLSLYVDDQVYLLNRPLGG